MFKRSNLFFLIALNTAITAVSQVTNQAVAKFSFNNGSEYDVVNKRKAKILNANYTADRFENDNCAVFLSGNELSYINLGNYKEFKSKEATIALWIKMENKIWSGTGAYYNPVILTKYTALDDFYEAYAIYYMLESERLVVVTAQDSTKERGIFSLRKFERNAWHHLAISYNYEYACFYLDGKLQGRLQKHFETKFLQTDSVVIGTTANKKNSRYLNASVDDIEFYDKVLTESEINDLYNAPNPNKNRILLNRILIVLVFMLFVGIIYLLVRVQVSRALKKEKQRLELYNIVLETELRVNRALMNPHFVFNSLNALQNFILKNENARANNYLVKFSKLIRRILESNMSDTITLEFEIELLERYLEIEDLRFEENIRHTITVHPALRPSVTRIPVMMLQPFIENAIWHGLLKKEGEKLLHISFFLFESNYVLCVIEDNGTGRKKKDMEFLENKSLATGFIEQRLDLLNKLHHLNAGLTIEDKPEGKGTAVRILLPILNN